MSPFAPVGNGRVLAYVMGDRMRYVRGTNVLRVWSKNGDETRYAAVGEEIVEVPLDFEPPPLGGATRAAAVMRIPHLADRDAVMELYARSVLVLAQHQELSGAFVATRGDDVLIAYALDVCGERGAAEAYYEWAVTHRDLDGLLMWGLEQHLRFVYRTPLRERYQRLKDGPGPELAVDPPEITGGTSTIGEALRRASELGLLTTSEGIDLRSHALFLIAVHSLVPKPRWGEDFFFAHQGTAQEMRRARALYGGAFHGGMPTAGPNPRLEVTVREGVQASDVLAGETAFTRQAEHLWTAPLPKGKGIVRYKVRIEPSGLWASDADPRPEGQEFAFDSEPGSPPDWVNDAVVYQVMVDRYARTDGALPAPGSSTALYGGTLDGITGRLDHIVSLGCNVIWLTPVHTSPSHHGYDIEDFFSVETRYGGDAALKRLIDSAHSREMRILLDFVPNHTGRSHPLFREALAKGGDAAGFYRFWQWPHYYRGFGDGIDLPELDTGNPRVQEYLVSAARHWVVEYGADGLRCDHVAGADPAFWVELRRALRAIRPDVLILGEATGRFDWLARYAGRLDAIFDFDFAHVVRQTFANGRIDAATFARWLDDHEHAFPGLALATLLDNHDMNRFLWMAEGNVERLKLAATLLMTLPGMPVIYYGTEVGLSQRFDGARENAEARLPMLWGEDQNPELLAHFQRLGRLRRASPALRRGSRHTLHADRDVLAYERVLGSERIEVTLNLKTSGWKVVDGSGRDRLREDDVLGVGPDEGPR